MKIQTGKSYKNQEGTVITIVDYSSNSSYPFKDSVGNSYTRLGRFLRTSETKLDLIEEVSTESTYELW